MADEHHVEDRRTDTAPLAGRPAGTATNNHHANGTAAPHRRADAAPLDDRQEAAAPPGPKDNFREIIETVVFVVVLVLLLKSFVAEAFVIPTGSMAETLWGYQKLVECPQCHHEFPVNCSSEVEPTDRERKIPVTGAVCPNCRYDIDFALDGINPGWRTGDRVLVSKYIYDTLLPPDRFDVVVFKYPVEPQKNHVPMNYIKRLIGLPGETIAIYYGDLYVSRDLKYEDQLPPHDVDAARERPAMYENDEKAAALFTTQVETQFAPAADGKKFEIIRKGPNDILAVRRLVFDNDCQPADLKGKRPPRWRPQSEPSTWSGDNAEQPRRFVFRRGTEEGFDWLGYQHIGRISGQPELVTDFMGYNTGKPHQLPYSNWVGDLILECDVTVAKPEGEFALELNKGVDRFQARWDLATGTCQLVRRTHGVEEVLASRPTDLKQKGTYRLRFANVDERLTVWVDGGLPFGDGVAYRPPTSTQRGPGESDLRPAGIGARGADVSVAHVKLWRDTYYTTARDNNPSGADAGGHEWEPASEAWHDPSQWEALRKLPFKTMYVQPGHFLCMGDNSPESSDGRSWGLVPRRLLLGRALLVYWPWYRAGAIR
jgi:signal peptidase I